MATESSSSSINNNKYMKEMNELVYSTAPSITFANVQFAYPNRPESDVLNQLSVNLPGGKVIALVGQSGAERFYEPKAGEILLNNYKLTDFNVNYLRGKLIGYISQEPQIFNASIRENIRFGRLDATDEEVI
ncbi:unnamed protein product [Trichobilharzia regenti]|nr:unnamed protein product [Trichobilharzia regenti]